MQVACRSLAFGDQIWHRVLHIHVVQMELKKKKGKYNSMKLFCSHWLKNIRSVSHVRGLRTGTLWATVKLEPKSFEIPVVGLLAC